MKKINIYKKKTGVQAWGAQFEDDDALKNWINLNIQNNSWGFPVRWIFDKDITTENISEAIEVGEDSINGVSHRKYKFDADYTIEIIDITEEIKKEEFFQKALTAQETGARVIAAVWALNESKEIKPEVLQKMMQDATLAMIERLLWNGSLKTASSFIEKLDHSFFSDEEKKQILTLLDQ